MSAVWKSRVPRHPHEADCCHLPSKPCCSSYNCHTCVCVLLTVRKDSNTTARPSKGPAPGWLSCTASAAGCAPLVDTAAAVCITAPSARDASRLKWWATPPTALLGEERGRGGGWLLGVDAVDSLACTQKSNNLLFRCKASSSPVGCSCGLVDLQQGTTCQGWPSGGQPGSQAWPVCGVCGSQSLAV